MTDLRELLILILALLILFSLLRAVYVIHRRRKGQIRLSIDKTAAQEAELEEPEFTELPNGGARTVAAEESGDPASEQAAADAESAAQDSLAGENVPVLLDPVSIAPAAEADAEPPAKSEPEIFAQPRQRNRRKNWKEEILGSGNGQDRERADFDLDLGAVSMTAGERIGSNSPKIARPGQQAEAEVKVEARIESESTATTEVEAQAQAEMEVETQAEVEAEPDAISADRIITINVIAGEDNEFNGRELWDFLYAAGLRHDKMKILSKTEGNRENGEPIFRVANIVNPGTFDADAIDEFSTPGISMFMLLPAPINNLLAFEQMLAVARRLAEALDGRLLDYKREAMTAQGIEQERRRIREFNMGTAGSSSVSTSI